MKRYSHRSPIRSLFPDLLCKCPLTSDLIIPYFTTSLQSPFLLFPPRRPCLPLSLATPVKIQLQVITQAWSQIGSGLKTFTGVVRSYGWKNSSIKWPGNNARHANTSKHLEGQLTSIPGVPAAPLKKRDRKRESICDNGIWNGQMWTSHEKTLYGSKWCEKSDLYEGFSNSYISAKCRPFLQTIYQWTSDFFRWIIQIIYKSQWKIETLLSPGSQMII